MMISLLNFSLGVCAAVLTRAYVLPVLVSPFFCFLRSPATTPRPRARPRGGSLTRRPGTTTMWRPRCTSTQGTRLSATHLPATNWSPTRGLSMQGKSSVFACDDGADWREGMGSNQARCFATQDEDVLQLPHWGVDGVGAGAPTRAHAHVACQLTRIRRELKRAC